MRDDDADGGDSDDEGRRKQAAAALQAAPKRAKLSVRDKDNAQRERVLSEVGMKKVPVARDRDGARGEGEGEGDDAQAAAVANKKKGGKAKAGELKVVRQSFAVGGLDQDYVDWGLGAGGSAASQGAGQGGMSKSQIRQVAREKPFTEFDATKKLRKGGKQGHSSFKSKSKFKRR